MELWYSEQHTENVKFSIKVDKHLFSAQSSKIEDMISKTIFAVSPDDLRRNLAGIYFEKNGKSNLKFCTQWRNW